MKTVPLFFRSGISKKDFMDVLGYGEWMSLSAITAELGVRISPETAVRFWLHHGTGKSTRRLSSIKDTPMDVQIRAGKRLVVKRRLAAVVWCKKTPIEQRPNPGRSKELYYRLVKKKGPNENEIKKDPTRQDRPRGKRSTACQD